MRSVAEVRLWGRSIGAVSIDSDDGIANFEYGADFSTSGIEPAPIMMPLSRTVYRFPTLPMESFHGLPGMLADSLPDRFGNAVIDAWLAGQGREPGSFNAVERLCYTGKRGMGALEFVPAQGPGTGTSANLDIGNLVRLAGEVLELREGLRASISDSADDEGLKQILRVGTSAGGARAKAIIAWNPATNEVRSGQVKAPDGFEYWLLKFDGVGSNRDKELADPKGYGAIEYAYHLMAKAAGIQMSECRLLEENGRRHFMTRRFDRTPTGGKLHMQSLGAMAHYDFNSAGSNAYEQSFMVMRRIGILYDGLEQQFRRMIFNLVARNQDDHVKNIAFLMDKEGGWSLAPAFDLTYSYQPGGLWTGSHQLSVNGTRDGFSWNDIEAAGRTIGLKRGRAATIASEIAKAVSRWPDFATVAGLPESLVDSIAKTFRLYLVPD